MNYSNEFLERVFAAYWGCALIIPSSGEISNYKVGDTDMHDLVKSNYYKLLLTPLSQISDEDAIEVAKIILPMPFMKYTKGWIVERKEDAGYKYIYVKHPKNTYSICIDCNLVEFSAYQHEECVNGWHIMRIHSCIDYLRSKGYDCGYGEISSLIDAGIAIKK